VKEAMQRLKEINRKTKEFHKVTFKSANTDDDSSAMDVDTPKSNSSKPNGKATEDDVKPWMNGNLYHRPETDLKTHTSYLTFAVLPREWTEEDEAAAFEKWPCGKEGGVIGSLNRQARKQQTREKLEARKKQKQEKDTQKEGADEETTEAQ
jgi:tRNA (adenine57-N1/adenine58-N1)-methyltransferase